MNKDIAEAPNDSANGEDQFTVTAGKSDQGQGFSVSLFTAKEPGRLSKAFSLGEDGKLVKAPGGKLAKGAVETAHRALQTCGQVFRYAIATGRADRDPSADIRGALTPAKEEHRAAILDPVGAGGLMRAIDSYTGHVVTRCALKLAAMTFVRPGELRHAEWAEIDFDNAEWRIPGPKMKMKEQHVVPLSRQAIAILRELLPLTGAGRYVFPSMRTSTRPMSEVTILAALRRLDYAKDEMTGHGFRVMASTLLNEAGWPPDVIERQLAHAERNKVRAAYNRASLLPERRKLMQAWADYLDALRDGDVNATCAPEK